MADIDELRRYELRLGLPRLEEVFTLYYDETNNIRRLHVRADGLNVKDPKVFVLGGVLHAGNARPLELADLRARLGLQDSVLELKFRHLAQGELLDALDAPRVEIFLDWLLSQDLDVHLFGLDPLYWSIVDVIDAILAEHPERQLVAVQDRLKNDLYGLLRLDPDRTIDLLRRYDYPDVGAARRRAFVDDLLTLLEEHEAVFEPFNFMMLKGLLQIGRAVESLPFLEHNDAHVLIDRFVSFFVKRICLFKQAHHILDVERVVMDHLASDPILDGGQTYERYRFAASNDEPGIQVSDMSVGLLGRLLSFVVATDRDDLNQIRAALTPRQAANLARLSRLLNRSLEITPAFVHLVMSVEDQFKLWRFVDGT